MTEREIKVFNRRLLKLADKLDEVPRNRFNYGSWVGDDWGGKPNLSCGTKACALGWATTMPEFRRLGLKLNYYGEPYLKEEKGGATTGRNPGDKNYHYSDTQDVEDVILRLFGNGCLHLFFPQSGEMSLTAKQVAKKIRRFVKARRRD